MEIKLTYPAGVPELSQILIGVQTQHPGDPGNTRDNDLSIPTIWQQNRRLRLRINICRHYGGRGDITRLPGWNCTN